MNKKLTIKTILLLISPLLLFFLLFLPYARINSAFLVDLLGCGCVESFNANDFTRCFFLFVSVCVTAISVLFSKWYLPKKWVLRIGYIVVMALASLAIADHFWRALLCG